jgi:hypothetical protein
MRNSTTAPESDDPLEDYWQEVWRRGRRTLRGYRIVLVLFSVTPWVIFILERRHGLFARWGIVPEIVLGAFVVVSFAWLCGIVLDEPGARGDPGWSVGLICSFSLHRYWRSSERTRVSISERTTSN